MVTRSVSGRARNDDAPRVQSTYGARSPRSLSESGHSSSLRIKTPNPDRRAWRRRSSSESMPEVAKWLRQTRASTSLWPGIGPSDTASRRVSTPPTAASRRPVTASSGSMSIDSTIRAVRSSRAISLKVGMVVFLSGSCLRGAQRAARSSVRAKPGHSRRRRRPRLASLGRAVGVLERLEVHPHGADQRRTARPCAHPRGDDPLRPAARSVCRRARTARARVGPRPGNDAGQEAAAVRLRPPPANRDPMLDQSATDRIRTRTDLQADLCQRQPAVVEVGYFVEARGIDSRTADLNRTGFRSYALPWPASAGWADSWAA